MKNRITLEINGCNLTLQLGHDGNGHIESALPRESLTGLKGADRTDAIKANTICDITESIILAHACAGIDVKSDKYIDGIETALEAASNELF